MDLLKKFRYNFNYWLKNCYQGQLSAEEHNREIYQTTNGNGVIMQQLNPADDSAIAEKQRPVMLSAKKREANSFQEKRRSRKKFT